MAFSLILSPPILFGCQFPKTIWKHDQKPHMQEGQVMSSSATTKAFIDNETTKDEALNFIASPWY
jgi:hypothetical protein